MTDILSTEDYELCGKLKVMRFSGMAEALEELLRDPNSDPLPGEGRTAGGCRMGSALQQEAEPLH